MGPNTNLRCKNMNNKPTAVVPPKTDLSSSFFWGFDFGISIPSSSGSTKFSECTLSSSGFISSYITKLHDRVNLNAEMNYNLSISDKGSEVNTYFNMYHMSMFWMVNRILVVLTCLMTVIGFMF